MTTPSQTVDAKAVQEAAKQYRSQGYDVVFDPPADDFPETVRPYRSSLLAKRGNERVAVEVVPHSRRARLQLLRTVAEEFREVPHWRLDVVVVGQPTSRPRTYTPVDKLRKRAEAAEQLASDTGDKSAALLLIWTAIEAALRMNLQRLGKASEEPTPARVVKQAISFGVVSEAQGKYLTKLAALRNLIAHGEEPPAVSSKEVTRARRVALRLLDDLASNPEGTPAQGEESPSVTRRR